MTTTQPIYLSSSTREGTIATSASLHTPKRRVSPAENSSNKQKSPLLPPLPPVSPQRRTTSRSSEGDSTILSLGSNLTWSFASEASSVTGSTAGGGGTTGFDFNENSSIFSAISSTSHRRKDWKCLICSYHNVDKYNDQCAVCGTLQDGTRCSKGHGRIKLSEQQEQAPIQPPPPPPPHLKQGISRSLLVPCQEDDTQLPHLFSSQPLRANSSPAKLHGSPHQTARRSTSKRTESDSSNHSNNTLMARRKRSGNPRRPSTGSTAQVVTVRGGSFERPEAPQQQRNDMDQDDGDLHPPPKPMPDRSTASALLPLAAISTSNGLPLSSLIRDNKSQSDTKGLQSQPDGDEEDQDEESDIDTVSLANSTISSCSDSTSSSFANASMSTRKASNIRQMLPLAVKSSPSTPTMSSLATPPKNFLSTGHRRPSAPAMVDPEEGVRMGKRPYIPPPSPKLQQPELEDQKKTDKDLYTIADEEVGQGTILPTICAMYAATEDIEHPSFSSSSSSHLPPSISGSCKGVSTSPTTQNSSQSFFVSISSPSSNTVGLGAQRQGALEHQESVGNVSSSSQGHMYAISQHRQTTPVSSFASISIDGYSSSQVAIRSHESNLQQHKLPLQRQHQTMRHKWNHHGLLGISARGPAEALDVTDSNSGTSATTSRVPHRKRVKRVCWMLILGGVSLSVALLGIVLLVTTRGGKNDSSMLVAPMDSSFPTNSPIAMVATSPTPVDVPVVEPPDNQQGPVLPPPTEDGLTVLESYTGDIRERIGMAVAMSNDGNVVAVAGDSLVRVLKYYRDDLNTSQSLLQNRRRISEGLFQQLGKDIPTDNTAAAISLASTTNGASDIILRLAIAYRDNLIVYQLKNEAKNTLDDPDIGSMGSSSQSWQVLGQKLTMGLVDNDNDAASVDLVFGSSLSLSRNGTRVASAVIVPISDEPNTKKVVVEIFDYNKESGWVRVVGHVMEEDEFSGGGTNRAPVNDIENVQVQLSEDGEVLAVLIRRASEESKSSVLVYPLGKRQTRSIETSATSTGLTDPWILKSDESSQDYFYETMALSGNGESLVATGSNQETHLFGYRGSDTSQSNGGGWFLMETIVGVGGTSVAISDMGDWVAIGDSTTTPETVSLYARSSPSAEGALERVSVVEGPRTKGSGFGSSMAVSTTTVAVGAPMDGDNDIQAAGSVYLFELP
jgi:hypothetical protein